jgi:hypothetical protein
MFSVSQKEKEQYTLNSVGLFLFFNVLYMCVRRHERICSKIIEFFPRWKQSKMEVPLQFITALVCVL